MVPIRQRARWRRRVLALAASAVAAAGLLTACGGGDGPPQLTWYINPDPNPPDGFEGPFGQAGIADRCSTDQYTIKTELLPQSATEQRIQLLRRLVAEDSSISLMSLDPIFTAEFAEAGFLEPLPDDVAGDLEQGTLQGAIDGATWNDQLVAAPLWANTQTLWFRKSLAKKAGLDMTKPVTWDQIIDAASENDATVGVQANKYEGYVVWINALVEGAGGDIVSQTEKGPDASVDIGGEAGTKAAEIVSKLAGSPTRARCSARWAARRAASWSTGPSPTTTTRTATSPTTSATPAIPRPSRASSRGPRSAASTSA